MQRGPVVLDIQAVVAFHPAAGVGVWEIATGSHGREDRGRRRVRGIVCQPGCTTGRNMNEPDDQLGVHEELLGADPIPDVFPGQDPNVDREWEKAKEDPMGGESPSS
jgi:hypothetical protein